MDVPSFESLFWVWPYPIAQPSTERHRVAGVHSAWTTKVDGRRRVPRCADPRAFSVVGTARKRSRGEPSRDYNVSHRSVRTLRADRLCDSDAIF
eukprot:7999021-Pyramimonas_sp.AAC.3